MYVMRQNQIKGEKRSGQEADKEIGKQNIQGEDNDHVRQQYFREDNNIKSICI